MKQYRSGSVTVGGERHDYHPEGKSEG